MILGESHQQFASPEEALEHYGVKGMRKGHGTPNRIDRKNGRDPKRLAILYGRRRGKKEPYSVQGKMADHVNNKVHEINDQYKNDDFSTVDWADPASWTPRAKEYHAEVVALTNEADRTVIKDVYGTTPDKRRTEMNETGDRLVIREVEVKHADEDEVVAVFSVIRDANGLVIAIEPAEPEVNDVLSPVGHGQDLKPFDSPEEALEHYGVKGMKWGVRRERQNRNAAAKLKKRAEKLEQPTASFGTKVAYGPKIVRDAQARQDRADAARFEQQANKIKAKREAKEEGLKRGSPEYKQRLERVTRTDHPQVLTPANAQKTAPKKEGLSRNQKIALTFGAATAAAAGYYAYQHYTGNKLPIDLEALARQDEHTLAGLKLPARWDVSGLKSGPISKQRLGDLAGGEFNLKLLNPQDLVINTSRGYADILPKDGLPSPFAVRQHQSVTRVLEEMRDKYPAIRNMNIEVVPMSRMEGMARPGVHMSVLTMRAGEARVMYNDLMDGPPSAATIRANAKHLPGLGKKDYVAYHEMGHLLAAAHGDLPPAFDIMRSDTTHQIVNKYTKADPILHRRTLAKHGFSFQELSKLSRYAATEPAEAVAELAGHYFHPEMRSRLTPDQLTRAEAMFNEMGGRT